MSSKMDTCCVCINLRTGCLIIGYLQLVFEAILAVLQGSTTWAIAMLFSVNRHDSSRALYLGILISYVIILLLIVLALGFTIALLVGVHQNKPGHIKAYLVFGYICLVLAIIDQVVLLTRQDVETIWIHFIIVFISLYFLMVIKTYHFKLREDNAKGSIVSSA